MQQSHKAAVDFHEVQLEETRRSTSRTSSKPPCVKAGRSGGAFELSMEHEKALEQSRKETASFDKADSQQRSAKQQKETIDKMTNSVMTTWREC